MTSRWQLVQTIMLFGTIRRSCHYGTSAPIPTSSPAKPATLSGRTRYFGFVDSHTLLHHLRVKFRPSSPAWPYYPTSRAETVSRICTWVPSPEVNVRYSGPISEIVVGFPPKSNLKTIPNMNRAMACLCVATVTTCSMHILSLFASFPMWV